MNKPITIALLGTGRMAGVYGPKLQASEKFELKYIYNPRLSSAQNAAEKYGSVPVDDLETLLNDDALDAVVIATPTDTHLHYIEQTAKAGKAIYCEKPLDQTMARVDQAVEILDAHPVPFMLGFNRRFDPDNNALASAVHQGQLGSLHFLQSTSREPSPPPIQYVKSSGGYFVDATIHDIDLLCYIAGEYPTEVSAFGSNVFNPEIGAEGDFDLTMTMLKFPSGAIAQINNSRQCSYGFDQRLEAFGTVGTLQTVNQRDDNLVYWNQSNTEAQRPLKHFFLERYDASFGLALDEFHAAVTEGRSPSATIHHGRMALAVALACTKAAKENCVVALDPIAF